LPKLPKFPVDPNHILGFPEWVFWFAARELLWHFLRMKNLPAFARFLKTSEPAGLGPETRPGTLSPQELDQDLAPLLETSNLSPHRQRAVRSLILLWHDHLEASHEIAQSIDNSDGAFVHGIMHRREPDFGNATYWFRRVGRHPAFSRLASSVEPVLRAASAESLAATLIPCGGWDPFAFINACEAAAGETDQHKALLRQIQHLEFEALLDSMIGSVEL
jgi:hypothetical protein